MQKRLLVDVTISGSRQVKVLTPLPLDSGLATNWKINPRIALRIGRET